MSGGASLITVPKRVMEPAVTSKIRSTPLIVNLFGAPCAGKSPTATDVYGRLKWSGVKVELVTEFAKDLTWERRKFTLSCQPYIFGKQLRNMERLIGGVDVIVTDSPILLSGFYSKFNDPERYPLSFEQYVGEQFKRMGGLNFFLHRTGPYITEGRSQTEEEAVAVGEAQLQYLRDWGVDFVELHGNSMAWENIVPAVQEELGR